MSQYDLTKGMSVYRHLLSFALPYWKMLVIGAVSMIIYGATDASFAMYMKPLLDGGFVNKDPDIIKWLPIGILGIFYLEGLLVLFQPIVLRGLEERSLKKYDLECLTIFYICQQIILIINLPGSYCQNSHLMLNRSLRQQQQQLISLLRIQSQLPCYCFGCYISVVIYQLFF